MFPAGVRHYRDAVELGTLLVVVSALAAAVMAVGIVDVLRLGPERFAAIGKRRYHWVLLIVYAGPLGVLLYAAAVRPQVVHPERYADDADAAAAIDAAAIDAAAIDAATAIDAVVDAPAERPT